MKVVIELVDNRWMVNGNKYHEMSDLERIILNTYFREIKQENKLN